MARVRASLGIGRAHHGECDHRPLPAGLPGVRARAGEAGRSRMPRSLVPRVHHVARHWLHPGRRRRQGGRHCAGSSRCTGVRRWPNTANRVDASPLHRGTRLVRVWRRPRMPRGYPGSCGAALPSTRSDPRRSTPISSSADRQQRGTPPASRDGEAGAIGGERIVDSGAAVLAFAVGRDRSTTATIARRRQAGPIAARNERPSRNLMRRQESSAEHRPGTRARGCKTSIA